ncbi:MAG: acyl-CoA thioesterase [Gammaproteobacteria bacterium]|nr:acyl-CoA thioesterase [Gammaproteobacteria bacterium]NNM10428.1 acyl-CoA thioesterase [Pseudomonadales bacterium]RZV58519.1 MAG: acyl-CoA thioesterase [Pseudomonadales bacterium]
MTNEKPFCHLLRVRYGECDAQQVVFNSRYLDYVDVAVTEFTRALWGDYNELLKSGYDNQVVSAKVDWKASARFDDVLAIYVELQRLGNTSYTLGVDIRRRADQLALAEVSMTYVSLDARMMTKIPVPDEMRAALQKGAPGLVVDQAGVNQMGVK